MGNLLFIPGLTSPVAEIRQLLFSQGQPGGSWIPSLSAAMIAANTFGSGVEDILDLSGNSNPFSQATPANRAAWFREPKTGRRNLLERTDEFDNAYWVKTQLGGTALTTVVTPNVSIAPDGSNTADRVFMDLAGGTTTSDRTRLQSGNITVASGVSVNANCYVRAAVSGDIGKKIRLQFDGASGFLDFVLTADWQRVSVSGTTTTTTVTFLLNIRGGLDLPDTADFFLWGAQLELGSTATAYQRVTTAFDVTEQGQRDCYGVRFDSVDDGYATSAIDFTNTNKMTVWVAYRKQTDATTQMLLEASAAAESNNGAFNAIARNLSGTLTLQAVARGTTSSTAGSTSSLYAAPVTLITCNRYLIASPLIEVTANNIIAASSTASLGTGNFGNHALFLGRRNNATLSLNGDAYGIIVAGDDYPLSIRQRVSRLLSRITPTVNL
jgi:hypothetical protein